MALRDNINKGKEIRAAGHGIRESVSIARSMAAVAVSVITLTALLTAAGFRKLFYKPLKDKVSL